MAGRKYSDKEVGQILSKAAALQSGSASFTSPEGTTLQELQRVAREVGLDPLMIERAATELEGLRRSTSGPKANVVLLEQAVDGGLVEAAWEQLVTAMRAHSGKPGKIEVRGDIREWTGGSNSESFMLSATNHQGRMDLKLLGDTSGWTAALIEYGIGFSAILTLASVVAAAKLGSHMMPLLTFSFILLAVFAGFLGTRAVIQRSRKAFAGELNALMDRLVSVSESPRAADLLSSHLTELPALTLSAVESVRNTLA
jgi:hypothetical protein